MAQVPLQPSDIPSWTDFVTQFDPVYTQFYDNYNALMSLGPYIQNSHPELLPSYSDLLQRTSVAADQLEGLKATRDYVASWLQWMQGGVSNFTTGAQAIYDYAKAAFGLSGMGQSAPIAYVVIGSAAAIYAIYEIKQLISELYATAQRYNALQAAEANGYTPDQAVAMVNATMGPPPATSAGLFGIPWTLLIWGAMAIFLGPPIVKAITERRR